MVNSLTTYRDTQKLWLYQGDSAWHFITLRKADARQITELFGDQKRGWGSLPVQVTIGSTTWKTSIFPDKTTGSYLLPIKAAVRQQENLVADQKVSFTIEILV